MKLGIDLKVDYAFKLIFGTQERIGNLRSLLEHTLQGRLSGPITELSIINPIQAQESEEGKLSILDILARDRSGKQYGPGRKFCNSYVANTSAMQQRKKIPRRSSLLVDSCASLRLARSRSSALVFA